MIVYGIVCRQEKACGSEEGLTRWQRQFGCKCGSPQKQKQYLWRRKQIISSEVQTHIPISRHQLILPFALYQLQMLFSKLARTFATSKIYTDPVKALEGIKDGSYILVGGFGFCGVPMNLVNALRLKKVQNLTIASNSCGVDGKDIKSDWGLSMLLRTRQIKRLIFSHLGDNVASQQQYFNGELELQVCPQGTLAEKFRSGGSGIPAFYTPTGVDTIVETGGYVIKYKKTQNGLEPQILSEPKPSKVFNGRKYIEQASIFGQFALVKAKRADTLGNLEFHMTARNFNADIARAAKCVIAEVEEIVEPGKLNPQAIHVPSIYVDRIYEMDPRSPYSENVVERLTLVDHLETKRKVKFSSIQAQRLTFSNHHSISSKEKIRYKIASRAAKEVKDGMTINLGIGIPTLLPEVIPHDMHIHIQSQNGVLGVGHHPNLQEVHPDNINAGKETITLLPGGAYFSSSDSFGMIRGGHLDVTMLGSFQVSENGDIANWMIPGKVMKGMGGAMDLVSSGSKVVVLMQHSAICKDGQLEIKLLPECTLPLTGKGVASVVITELAVFENRGGKLILTEISEDTTLEEVQRQTGFTITCAQTLKKF